MRINPLFWGVFIVIVQRWIAEGEPLKQNKDLKTFYLEALKPLIEYDRDHKSNLIHTLDMFLYHQLNIKDNAALSLFIATP